jgi:adenine-specific DNA-methyltransferase
MKEQPEQMTGTSLDISAENRARLKALFPTVFTETVNDKGELVESMDFEKLKAELGTFTDLFESRRERYGMDWPGKKEALRLIQTPSAATLKPCREESVNFDTTENLFIEGDNLEVLKLLQKSYYGKVKMIDIDPPYNTGKEFIYPDNYSESLETYLEYAGLIDGEGKKFSTNTANEGRFHTKWLNMMYPRLYLARNLLRDDGVIFIHIDDNEASNLRKMCDEIFGEENFIAQLIWKCRAGGGADSKFFSNDHEYVFCYSKNTSELSRFYTDYTEEQLKKFQYEDDRGKYFIKTLEMPEALGKRPNLQYPITAPDGSLIQSKREGTNYTWVLSEPEFLKHKEKGLIEFKLTNGKWMVYRKYHIAVANGETRQTKPRSIMDKIALTANGGKELKLLFNSTDEYKIFDNSKPTDLIKYILKIVSDNHDIILDFFSGSATTAHAVLDLNKQDSGNRKFIMIQLPEPCAEDSEAFKSGYKTIADIGKERIRRVIKKLNEEQAGKLDLGGASAQDRGFKVLKLDKSNFKQWQKLAPDAKPEQIEKQLFDHIDHIDHKATPEDLLFEILIKAGFMPTEKVQTIKLADVPVFSIADGGLLICLADTVTKELINDVAEAEPMQFICLDKAFGGNDQLKANAVQTFNARNMGREKANQIVFRTV